jgi:hypothetical protein
MSPDENASIADQFAAAAMMFGMVSLATCWWFPFGPTLGAVGTFCGMLAWRLGSMTERGMVGMALAASGMAAGLLLAWEYWWRLFGLATGGG